MTRLLALPLLLPTLAQAVPAPCPEHHPGGQAPDLLRPALSVRTVPLCNRAFATLHSGQTRGPLYSAEHLTAEGVAAAASVARVNLFHPDSRVPVADRAELRDYAGGPYDRGHMAPSGDMPDAAAQAESFALSNMVPQAPALNRGPWERIEQQVRDLVRQHGDAWVVTGPAFVGDRVGVVGRVLVPTATWKAVWVPNMGAAVWWAENRAGGRIEVVPLDELERRIGVRAFPAVLGAGRGVVMTGVR